MRLHFKHWSLATTWSITLTALALAPLLLVIRSSYETSAQKILEKSVLALANGASDSATGLDDALTERIRQARYLANLQAVREFVASPAQYRLNRIMDMRSDLKATQVVYPYIQSLDILSPAGEVLYSNTGNQKPFTEPDLFKTVAAGQTYVAPLQTEADHRSSLVIAVPIASGSESGVLRMESDPQALMNRVARDNQRQGAGTLGLLVDDQGRVLARSDGAAGGELGRLDPLGTLTMPDGTSYYAQKSQLDAVKWTYVLAMPTEQIAIELQEQRTRSLILAGGISLIIGGLARLLALRLTKPLSYLADATQALGTGDLSFGIQPTDRKDEIGKLHNSFHETFQQLRRMVARMRLSSHLVAEASTHLYSLTSENSQVSSAIAGSSEKLSVVAKDLEKQVAHFRV